MNKITNDERDLIEDLLRSDKDLSVEAVAFLTGRSVRSIYYIMAEMKKRNEETKLKPFYKRLLDVFKGEDYEKVNTTRTRTNGRASL